MSKQPPMAGRPAVSLLARRLAPAFIALLFAALAAGLIAVYRGGDDGSPSAPSPSGPGAAAAGLALAPALTLPAVDGGAVSLADSRGRENVLLFVNEGVM